ncbi:MAG: hypothetical protein PHC69_02665 [Ruminiclostridium sp.]|nr:hypothetical protein [Ruminiclostridium sp.]
MKRINQENLILEKDVFERIEIERLMEDGGFNSITRFELFIWDLEMFLQLQKKLGDKILLKGGAATQLQDISLNFLLSIFFIMTSSFTIQGN